MLSISGLPEPKSAQPCLIAALRLAHWVLRQKRGSWHLVGAREYETAVQSPEYEGTTDQCCYDFAEFRSALRAASPFARRQSRLLWILTGRAGFLGIVLLRDDATGPTIQCCAMSRSQWRCTSIWYRLCGWRRVQG